MDKKQENKEYYEKNKEKILKRHKEYNKKNREKNREYQKKIAREWARKHPEKIKVSREKFKRANPEKRSAWRKVERIKIPYAQLCQRCAIREAVDRHHKNYSKPKEFEFLCKICHAQADKERRDGKE